MRLLIDTSGVQFRVCGAAKPRPDFKDKDRQATTRDGEPIWTARLDAIERITGSSSRPAAVPQWSRITYAGAGTRSAGPLAWIRHGFMI